MLTEPAPLACFGSARSFDQLAFHILKQYLAGLSAQQFGVSFMGEVNGPPWNLLQCACWCLFGVISITAAILTASVDCSWALWMIASCPLGI